MNSKKLTAQCAVLQGSYWVAVCAINGFATVFLLHIGLKSSQIGVVLALGNILGVILQPFVAAAADRAKRVTLQQMTAGMAIAIILLLILMQCMSKMVPGIVLSFLIVNMLLQVVQPLINSISLYYVNHGIYVDFGIGRGVGSASYAVAASFLGILIGRYYGLAIMGVGCLSFAVMFVTLISMPVVKDPNESKKEEQKNTANRQRGGGILEFARRYRNYMLVLLGMILIYVESTYVNNYLINIVVSLGGRYKTDGNTADSICNERTSYDVVVFQAGWQMGQQKTDSVCGGNVFCESTGVSGVWQYIVPVCSADAADVIICIMSAFCGILCK